MIDVGDVLVIGGLRVDSSAAGAGSEINVSVSAITGAGEPPITFFGGNSAKVADVEDPFTFKYTGGRAILTCTPNAELIGVDLEPDEGFLIELKISEKDRQAFTTDGDETLLANYGDDAQVSMVFVVNFVDVPNGVTVKLFKISDNEGGDDPFLDIALVGGMEFYEQTADGIEDLEFSFEVSGTSASVGLEDFVLLFQVYTKDELDSVGLGETIDVEVTYEAGDLSDGEVPEFVNTGEVFDGFSVNDCTTRLEYTWVVSNVAGYDTGIAIANTTEDDAAFGAANNNGAQAQDGNCVLTGYPSAGGAPISSTSPEIAVGETWAFNVSTLAGFDGFAGYVLGVCNFLNAHSFAFITDWFGAATAPMLAQGYEANVIPAGHRSGPEGESLGK